MTDLDAIFRRFTAGHESFHLAGALELLGPDSVFGDAEIHLEDPFAFGHASITHGLSDEQLEDAHYASALGLPMDPEVRRRIEGFCIAVLAGYWYESAVINRENLWSELPETLPPEYRARKAKAVAAGEPAPETDGAMVDRLLLQVSASNLEAFAWRSWLDQRTSAFVHLNRRFRVIAEALDAALHESGRLSHAEITHIHYRVLHPPIEPRPAAGTSGYY